MLKTMWRERNKEYYREYMREYMSNYRNTLKLGNLTTGRQMRGKRKLQGKSDIKGFIKSKNIITISFD